MKQFARIAFAIAAASLIASCSRPIHVKIGFVGPLSGPIADFGKDMLRGTEVAIDELNHDGFIKIDGRPVHFELVVEDDKSDPEVGKAAAKRLLDAGIAGAIAHANSGVAIPNAAQFAAAGVPGFSLATNPKYTRMGYKTVFRVQADDVEQGNAMTRLADKLKVKAPFIVDDKTTYGIGLSEVMVAAYKAKNMTVPVESVAAPKDSAQADYSELAKKIIAANADAVLYGGTEEVALPLLKALRAAGSQAKFVGGDGMCSLSAVKHAGPDADTRYYCTTPGVPASWLSNGINFVQLFQAKFKSNPGPQAATTYESVHIMADAMQRANSTDPKVYLPQLTKEPFQGKIQGAVSFDAKGDIVNATVVAFQANNGELVEQRDMTR